MAKQHALTLIASKDLYILICAGDNESKKSSSASLLQLDYIETLKKISSNDMQNSMCPNKPHDNPTERKPKEDVIQKDNMDELLSWALLGLPFFALHSNSAMQTALEKFHFILQSQTGLSFEPGKNPNYRPRSYPFEKVRSLYKPFSPFFVYASVALIRIAANCMLFILGLGQYSCKRGLTYWHHSAKDQKRSSFYSSMG